MKKETEHIAFTLWVVQNLPQAKIGALGTLKILIGSSWVSFHDAPEAMQRGVFADFHTSVKN